MRFGLLFVMSLFILATPPQNLHADTRPHAGQYLAHNPDLRHACRMELRRNSQFTDFHSSSKWRARGVHREDFSSTEQNSRLEKYYDLQNYAGLKNSYDESNKNMFTEKNITGFAGVQEEWVRRYASGLAPANDYASDLAVDKAGNIYVTGYSSHPFNGADYLTIKYDSKGKELWTMRYNGPDDMDDFASSLALDPEGNVAITGISWSSSTGYDLVTIKYSSGGTQIWQARSGTGVTSHYQYLLPMIALDDAGNVIVAGNSWSEDNGFDLTAVKYNSQGRQLWDKRYNHIGASDEIFTDLAVDLAGNIIVVGNCWHQDGSLGVTVKYDSMGSRQWVTTYPEAENAAGSIVDMAVDASGNVIVTGHEDNVNFNPTCRTIKYDADGRAVWDVKHEGAANSSYDVNALVVDSKEHIILAGIESVPTIGTNYKTIKYDEAGNCLWEALFEGPESQFDTPSDRVTDLSLDQNDNIVVVGYSTLEMWYSDWITIKYDGSGNKVWTAQQDGFEGSDVETSAVVADGLGQVYITGFSYTDEKGYDYYTVKYDMVGAEEWVTSYDGLGSSEDMAEAMTIDAAGNIYATGCCYCTGSHYDITTVKYDIGGNMLWAVRYNGPDNSNDWANSIAVDSKGNVLVSGTCEDLSWNGDYTTIKYDANGNMLWEAQYDGPAHGDDYTRAMIIDSNDNILLTGFSTGSEMGTLKDFATIKYAPTGQQLWVARYNGPGKADDNAWAVAADRVGNVYVTGSSWGGSSESDYATIKYDAAGNEIWVARYNGPANSYDVAYALALDAPGNIYVTGSSSDKSYKTDCITLKYSGQGDLLWSALYNGPANEDDKATELQVDPAGYIYVAGNSVRGGWLKDQLLVKYNSAGNQIWVARFHNSDFSSDQANCLALDQNGNIYLSGESWDSSPDFATIKYDSDGHLVWTMRFSGPGIADDLACDLAVDSEGNVIVLGTSATWRGSKAFSLVRYAQSPTAVPCRPFNPDTFALQPPYPNPFNPFTTIHFCLAKATEVQLNVYNANGQLVRVLVQDNKPAGAHQAIWDGRDEIGQALGSGIYFCRLQADGTGFETKKMVLMR
jgi:uncharacterized delta-60 repeat protein